MTFTTKDLARYGYSESDIFGKPFYKNQKLIFAGVFILALLFSFYWFQYRPSAIRQDCYTKMAKTGYDFTDGGKDVYDECLASNGL